MSWNHGRVWVALLWASSDWQVSSKTWAWQRRPLALSWHRSSAYRSLFFALSCSRMGSVYFNQVPSRCMIEVGLLWEPSCAFDCGSPCFECRPVWSRIAWASSWGRTQREPVGIDAIRLTPRSAQTWSLVIFSHQRRPSLARKEGSISCSLHHDLLWSAWGCSQRLFCLHLFSPRSRCSIGAAPIACAYVRVSPWASSGPLICQQGRMQGPCNLSQSELWGHQSVWAVFECPCCQQFLECYVHCWLLCCDILQPGLI